MPQQGDHSIAYIMCIAINYVHNQWLSMWCAYAAWLIYSFPLVSFLCKPHGFIYVAKRFNSSKELPLGVGPILFLGVMGLNTHPDPFLLLSIPKYAGVKAFHFPSCTCTKIAVTLKIKPELSKIKVVQHIFRQYVEMKTASYAKSPKIPNFELIWSKR